MSTPTHQKRVCVFTYVFGAYESVLREPAPGGIVADYVCLTDSESKIAVAQNSVWSGRLFEPRLARYPKIPPSHRSLYIQTLARTLPSEVFERNSYDIVIYVDANISLTDSSLLPEMIQMGRQSFAEIVLSKHPLRDCVYEEAAASTFPKYSNNDFDSQTASYREQGCPDHVGLYWSGLCVFLDPFGERTIAFGQKYFDESLNVGWARKSDARWHPQGQMALAKVLFDVGALPSNERKVNAQIRVADFPPAYGIRCLAYVHAANG